MLLLPTLLCPKSWENMSGGHARRFCTHCQKHVHNLEALSVEERLALLTSPAASVCSRYQAAIRRPAKGKEEAYWKHLMKYGAGVAVAGSVLLVLWEMQDPETAARDYRALTSALGLRPMPQDLYVERRVHLTGEVMLPTERRIPPNAAVSGARDPNRMEAKFDAAVIDKLIEHQNPAVSAVAPPGRD